MKKKLENSTLLYLNDYSRPNPVEWVTFPTIADTDDSHFNPEFTLEMIIFPSIESEAIAPFTGSNSLAAMSPLPL